MKQDLTEEPVRFFDRAFWKRPGMDLGRVQARFAFVLVMAAMSFTYDYGDILYRRPQGFHNWRQSDCLSIVLNYSRPDARFMETEIHYLGAKGTGKTISEFPLIYYAIGRLWSKIGQNEPVYRGTILLIFYLGLFALYSTLAGVLKNRFSALFITALMFTSPMLAYYANNFIMNVPALSMAFMGWWAIWSYLGSLKKPYMILGFALFLVAGALKATAALSLLIVIFLALISPTPLGRILSVNISQAHRKLALALGMIDLIILGTWYSYAHHYNTANANTIFLVGILPVWDLDRAGILDVLRGIKVHAMRDYFRPFLYPFFSLLLISVFVHHKRVHRTLLAILFMLFTGAIGISVLFFQALRDHDYYSLDQVIIIPALFVCGHLALEGRFPAVWRSWWVQLAMVATLVHCTDFTRRRMLDRYSGWMNHEYVDHQQAFNTIAPYLNSIGIRAEDRIICLPDPSPNITLYLMDRYGWTDFDSLSFHPDRIERPIQLGARYLFIYKRSVESIPGMSRYLTEPIGQYQNVAIYELDANEPSRSEAR